jgi:hypothetical protein
VSLLVAYKISPRRNWHRAYSAAIGPINLENKLNKSGDSISIPDFGNNFWLFGWHTLFFLVSTGRHVEIYVVAETRGRRIRITAHFKNNFDRKWQRSLFYRYCDFVTGEGGRRSTPTAKGKITHLLIPQVSRTWPYCEMISHETQLAHPVYKVKDWLSCSILFGVTTPYHTV